MHAVDVTCFTLKKLGLPFSKSQNKVCHCIATTARHFESWESLCFRSENLIAMFNFIAEITAAKDIVVL